MDVTLFLSKVEACIIEVENNNLRNSNKEEGSFSKWDVDMCKKWFKLINPPMTYSKANKQARIVRKWEPPLKGWAKLNFDGASRGKLGTIGLASIIHSNKGLWIVK